MRRPNRLPSPHWGLRRRLAAGLRAGNPPSDRWALYLKEVEPALAAVPRVHRFAQPPVIGPPELAAVPMAVWTKDRGDLVARTHASLSAGAAEVPFFASGDLREVLLGVRADWILLARAGDEPAPLTLERFGQAAALAPDANVVTCDDDLLDASGRRVDPRFRPGPSPDRWLSCDDSGPLLAVRRERAAALLQEFGDADVGRHELALALAGPGGDGHAHIPVLLCHRGPASVPDHPSAPQAITRLLRRWEPAARAMAQGEIRRIHRPLAGEPSVEVVICFRDRPELLARCIVSVLARSDYDRLSLALVDNGSSEPDTKELVGRLSHHPKVRVLREDRPFNFAALNNAAALTSRADVLVFLNNDTEIVESNWLQSMLEEALRPEIGAVAPLLLYPDGKVQHAGAAIGLHGYAGHPFAGLSPDARTPFGYAAEGTRNWLAVTAACMMVQRAKFSAVGGFDEAFVVGGNDVDLCLRLTAAGYRSLCVPHAVVLHDESRSRGAHVDPGDFVASERSYGEFRTVGDPFYNPNLTLDSTDCSVRTP